MAYRSVGTGDILSFRACAIRLRDGQLVGVEFRAAASERGRMDGLCPVHESDTCVETYLAAGYLAGWSLRDFWVWRSTRRRMRGGRKAVAS